MGIVENYLKSKNGKMASNIFSQLYNKITNRDAYKRKIFALETYYDINRDRSKNVQTIKEVFADIRAQKNPKIINLDASEHVARSLPRLSTLDPKKDLTAPIGRKGLNGKGVKEFLTIKPDSMGDMLSDIASNNSYYVTHLGNISDPSEVGNISVVSKRIVLPLNNVQFAKAEEISSKILNILHVPTSYNQACITYMPTIEDNNTIAPKLCNLSVNFIGENEKLIHFCDISKYGIAKNSEYDCIYEWSRYIPDMYDRTCRTYNFDSKDSEKCQILTDFYKSYISRRYILQDDDFATYNTGFLVNEEEKTIHFAPNFDMEFVGYYSSYNDTYELTNSLKLMHENDPIAYNDFLENMVQSLTETDDKPSIIYETILDAFNGEETLAQSYINRTNYNISKVLYSDKELFGLRQSVVDTNLLGAEYNMPHSTKDNITTLGKISDMFDNNTYEDTGICM